MRSATRKNNSAATDTHGVTGVLNTAGRPLDTSIRTTLEPRFGVDFSAVRVHNDRDAARSAAGVHARAWTYGDHIAFAPGAYAPHTHDGLQLLAHELTHVAQHRSASRSATIAVGAPHGAAESEADTVASAVTRGEHADIAVRSSALQRQSWDDFDDPWPEKTEAARIRAEMPAYLQWRGTHPAGFPLSAEETDTAEKATGTKAPKDAARAAGVEPKFVLHDTASAMTVKAHFKPNVGLKGPQGVGWAAGVPHPKFEPKKNPELDPIVTRDFYEEKRPTTTGFEKGEDIIKESTRETLSKDAWTASAPAVRTAALDAALAGTGLADQDAKDVKAATTKVLDKRGTSKVDGVKTTIAWTSIEICKRVAAEGADAIADPDPKKHKKAVKTLEDTCNDPQFTKWIDSRSRLGERVNVEISQVDDKAPLPNPPYGATQYEGVAGLYLKAALEAHRWPFVTTHRWEDRNIPGGHGDPRCFDLDNLYSIIATKMSHPAGTIYGLVPSYGAPGNPDANITWTPGLCHGKSPTVKAAEAKAKEAKKAGATK